MYISYIIIYFGFTTNFKYNVYTFKLLSNQSNPCFQSKYFSNPQKIPKNWDFQVYFLTPVFGFFVSFFFFVLELVV